MTNTDREVVLWIGTEKEVINAKQARHFAKVLRRMANQCDEAEVRAMNKKVSLDTKSNP